jgi:hypothetical protein
MNQAADLFSSGGPLACPVISTAICRFLEQFWLFTQYCQAGFGRDENE